MKPLSVLSLLFLVAAVGCEPGPAPTPGAVVRFGQFNIWELGGTKLDQVDAEGRGTSPQLTKAAEILQRTRPDVLLINEIDFDSREGRRLAHFQERYLGVSQGGQEPLTYRYAYTAPVNTGVPTGLDLDHDGASDGPGDGFGYGSYPGQYGMALLSQFPIDEDRVRSFQRLLWSQMPGNLLPDGQDGKPLWYGPEEVEVFRLSSKSHWDVPVEIGGDTIHVIAAHPTPMGFDGPEDRNGRRNFDEIRLIADYIAGGERASYLVDDAGRRGGVGEGVRFVVMGDMNNNPLTDPALYGVAGMTQVLNLERVQATNPHGEGGGIDYVLPSVGLEIVGQGVFWPPEGDPLRFLVEDPEPASDHRMIWVDLRIQ